MVQCCLQTRASICETDRTIGCKRSCSINIGCGSGRRGVARVGDRKCIENRGDLRECECLPQPTNRKRVPLAHAMTRRQWVPLASA